MHIIYHNDLWGAEGNKHLSKSTRNPTVTNDKIGYKNILNKDPKLYISWRAKQTPACVSLNFSKSLFINALFLIVISASSEMAYRKNRD